MSRRRDYGTGALAPAGTFSACNNPAHPLRRNSACAPTRVIDPRVHGDVRESTVTVVVVEDVVSEVCDVQVLKAVVIVVPDSDSHSVAHMPDSGFLSDVHELELSGLAQEVTEEPVAGLPVRRRRKLRFTGILSRVDHRALHHIDVQVAVIVVIEEGDTCSHNFGHVVLPRGTREMTELQPNSFSHFAEQRNGWGRWTGGLQNVLTRPASPKERSPRKS